MRASCSVSNSDVISCSDVTPVIVQSKPLYPQSTSARLSDGYFLAFAHSQQRYEVLSSCTYGLCFIHFSVDLAITLPPPQNVTRRRAQRLQFPCPIRIHWCGLVPVCHAPLSVRLVHRFPLMRFIREHLQLVAISEINQTSSDFPGNWDN